MKPHLSSWIALLLSVCFSPSGVSAQSPESVSGEWLDVFGGISATDERVTALERMPDGRLLIGGYFDEVAGVSTGGIAIWDGASVTAFPGDISTVLDVATYGDSILVGGYIHEIDGERTNGLALWDGSAWELLGNQLRVYETATPYVIDFKVIGDTVYIGGNLSEAYGVVSEGIIGWNGSEFFSLAGGVSGPGTFDTRSSEVISVDVDSNGDLYVGGRFTGAGSIETGAVARWDGEDWYSLGSGVHGYVESVVVAGPDSVYVGGSFSLTEDGPAVYAAVWDGTEFTPLEGGPDGWVVDLVRRSDGSIVFSGGGRLWSWDGAVWTEIGAGIDGGVMTMEDDVDGSLLVGGHFATTELPCGSNIARYRNGQWDLVIPDTNQGATPWAFLTISVVDVDPVSGDVFAGGNFKCIGNSRAPYVARWDGSRWSPVASELDASVSAMTFDHEGNLVVGGRFQHAGGTPVQHVARLVEGVWEAMGLGLDDRVTNLEACPDGNVYASERSTNSSPAGNIARWNGESWQALDAGIDVAVIDFECDPTGSGVFVGGWDTSSGDSEFSGIAHWTGTEWQSVGGGVSHENTDNPQVGALRFDSEGNLLIGGSFTSAGNVPANHVARWTGSNWEEVGGGLDGYVADFAFDDNGRLYAVGSFTSEDPPYSYIAALVDGVWTGLDGEPDESPRQILATQFGMVLTGGFLHTGLVRANKIGIWQPDPVDSSVSEPAIPTVSELEVYPSPALDRVTVKVSTPSVIGREISIVNTLGRIVARFETGPNSGEPLDIDVRDYPAGLYLVVVRSADGSLIQRKSVVVL